MSMKFGQFFASITGREVAEHDGLGDIECAVASALHKDLELVRSASNLIASRGNIFRYSKGALDGLDSRINSFLPANR